QIQQQRHSSIAENGGAADQIGRDQTVVNALDDEFFFAAEFIHRQRVASTVDADHDGVKVQVTMCASDAKQRKDVLAHPDHFAAINHMNIVFSGANDFSDAGDRKRIGL